MNTKVEMLSASELYFRMKLMQVLKNAEKDVYKILIVIPLSTMQEGDNAISIKSSSQIRQSQTEISFSARTAVIMFEMNNSIFTITEKP